MTSTRSVSRTGPALYKVDNVAVLWQALPHQGCHHGLVPAGSAGSGVEAPVLVDPVSERQVCITEFITECITISFSQALKSSI